jgi:hypothetical protein
MNKFAILSVLLLAGLVAAVVPNPVDIRVALFTAGDTKYRELDTVSGADTWMPYNNYTGVQATAYVLENVFNNGILSLGKQVTGTGNWGMQEDADIVATGYTTIKKDVVWWTVDTDHYANGTLRYPTVTNIYTDIIAMNASGAVETEGSLHSTANQPPAHTYNSYAISSVTIVPVSFVESVGINQPERCAVQPPLQPTVPKCIHCIG